MIDDDPDGDYVDNPPLSNSDMVLNKTTPAQPLGAASLPPASTVLAPTPSTPPKQKNIKKRQRSSSFSTNNTSRAPAPKDSKLKWTYEKRYVLELLFTQALTTKHREALFNHVFQAEIPGLGLQVFPYSRMGQQMRRNAKTGRHLRTGRRLRQAQRTTRIAQLMLRLLLRCATLRRFSRSPSVGRCQSCARSKTLQTGRAGIGWERLLCDIFFVWWVVISNGV